MMGQDRARRGLIRFDLPSIPPSARIKKATLLLYAYGLSHPKRPHKTAMAVHRVLAPWTETECTWVESRKRVPWASPGASALGKDIAAEPESAAETTNLYVPIRWDVTHAVRIWYGEPSSNHGLLVKLGEEDHSRYQNAHIFATSKTTEPMLCRYWPSLVIQVE